ncbi:hypothetical protein PPYR_10964 [Photinus pyralis]|uniref:Saposin B-type domain-containing protein n=1 Tax=Photinus pyralis TaxID=7054 RepID=A0A1Y1LMZ5_PHOPY|nr:uncharacterized protein LOC116175018 [Photinus pyralis]KAB0796903.1 hypothetical protein PPYR_10964 [Photinus pyralis]
MKMQLFQLAGAIALLSIFCGARDLEQKQGNRVAYQITFKSMECLEWNIGLLSFDELCPIFQSSGCSSVPWDGAVECVANKIASFSEQQAIAFLGPIVPTINRHIETLNCTKLSLEGICPRLCTIPGANLCPNNQLDLYALINYVQNNDIVPQC